MTYGTAPRVLALPLHHDSDAPDRITTPHRIGEIQKTSEAMQSAFSLAAAGGRTDFPLCTTYWCPFRKLSHSKVGEAELPSERSEE